MTNRKAHFKKVGESKFHKLLKSLLLNLLFADLLEIKILFVYSIKMLPYESDSLISACLLWSHWLIWIYFQARISVKEPMAMGQLHIPAALGRAHFKKQQLLLLIFDMVSLFPNNRSALPPNLWWKQVWNSHNPFYIRHLTKWKWT